MERYYVDERVGCIAVKDSTLIDPEDSCLEPDSSGVIKFWMGVRKQAPSCPTCGHQGDMYWTVKDTDKQDALNLCKQLNLDDVSQQIGEKNND